MYDNEDDQLLLNPISLINQYELEKENNQKNLKENLNVNTFQENKSIEVNCDNIDTSFHKAKAPLINIKLRLTNTASLYITNC